MRVIDFLKNVEMTPSPVRTRCHSSIPLIRTLHLSTTGNRGKLGRAWEHAMEKRETHARDDTGNPVNWDGSDYDKQTLNTRSTPKNLRDDTQTQ